MASKVQFVNPVTGQTREGFEGFSWTTLFFGPFAMIFRGFWSGFFVTLILALLTWGLTNFVFIFFINKWHRSHLRNKGFMPMNEHAYHMSMRSPVIHNIVHNNVAAG